jgi:hypothetical protein
MDAYREPTSSKRQAGPAVAAEHSQAEGPEAAGDKAQDRRALAAAGADSSGLVVNASSSQPLLFFPNFEAVVDAIAAEVSSSGCGPAGPLPVFQQQQHSQELAAAAAAAQWPEVCYSSDKGLDALEQQQQQVYPDSQAEALDAYPGGAAACSGNAQRPMSIASVKLQQDLQIRAQAEAAEHT